MFGFLGGAGDLISRGLGNVGSAIGSGLKKYGAGLAQPGDAGGPGNVGATTPGSMPTPSLPGAAGGAGAAPADPNSQGPDPNSWRGRLQQLGAGMGNAQQMGGYAGGAPGANFGAGLLGGFSGARGKRQDLMKRRQVAGSATPTDADEEDVIRAGNGGW